MNEYLDNKEFGQRVRTARKRKKMTQVELANVINKQESTIRKYENGSIKPPWDIIEQIASALDVSPFDLTIDVKQLRADVKLQEEIQQAFGKDALDLLNDFDSLNFEGKTKACDYVSDLTINPKYKKEKPSSAATDNGSNNENTVK